MGKKKEEEASKEPVKEPEPKLATDLSMLYARPQVEESDYIVFNDLKVPFKFHKVSWGRYNQIVSDAMDETAEQPDHYDRVKQEKMLKEMITEIAGVRFDDDTKAALWSQLDSAFCETLRRVIFDGTGEMRVSGAMLKNLLPNLEEQIQSTVNTKLKQKR